MTFKRSDNKLDFCQCCQWFSGVVYYIEMMGYIAQGNLNIRILRDITGEMWFGVVELQLIKSYSITTELFINQVKQFFRLFRVKAF